MRLLDRYLVKTFTKVFVGALIVFAVGGAALDFFGRLGHFMKDSNVEGTFAQDYSGVKLVFLFYVAYLPFLLKEVLPAVTVAAALLTLTSMVRNNEVFPVVAAGVSVRRLFLPLFLCGLAVAALHLAFQEFVVPALSREQIALKRFFQGDRKKEVDDLDHLRDGRGTVTRVSLFSFNDRSLRNAVIMRPWGDAGFERWRAPRLVPDGDGWVAPEGVKVQPAGIASVARRLPPGTRVDIGVTPAQVEALASKKGTAELSFTQLQDLVEKFPDRRHLRVALHKQVARPLTSFALLLVGVPILLAAGRSLYLGTGVALGLSAGYYFLDIFFTSLGDRGDLPAVFAAYFPLALLLSLGVARLVTVPT